MKFYVHIYNWLRNTGFNFGEDPDILNNANKVSQSLYKHWQRCVLYECLIVVNSFVIIKIQVP